MSKQRFASFCDVGLILCTDKGHALARYALNGLANKIMAVLYSPLGPENPQSMWWEITR